MKRVFALLCTLVAMCILVGAKPVFRYENTTPITDTVSLTNVREFHSDHNISYSYIKMDLSDERVGLKLLTSPDGTDTLLYMSELANADENTLAALNGDFFSVYSGSKGFSLGIEKENGNILQSPINPDTMATVAYDGRNVLMTYLDFHVFAVAENWEYKEIRHINKHTSYYGDLLMYTSDFNGGYSPSVADDVVMMVVEDDTVKEFVRNSQGYEIPENGYVLLVSEGSSMFLSNNFAVGEKVKLDYYVTPSLDEFDTAFGGGSMLVHEGEDVGKVGDYTHTVSGYNPRSAIGVSEDGNTLYLVAVDGRSENSRGMRMSHLAELMIELGCYTAVNLDGGGSSRMLASTLWEPQLKAVNNPSENRRVINAVGIVLNNDDDAEEKNDEESEEKSEDEESYESDALNIQEQSENGEEQDIAEEKVKKADGIKIKPTKSVALVGETVEFEIAVHDEQLRSVTYDSEKIVLFSSQGRIEDGVLVSDEGAVITVGVEYDGLYCETQVVYIDKIEGITVPDNMVLTKGEKVKIPIYVFDSLGRFHQVENFEGFEIASSDENVVAVKNNEITAVDDGVAVVTVSREAVTSHIAIAVGTYSEEFVLDFEYPAGNLAVYPLDTLGDFEISDENAFSGKHSGKISFDFTSCDEEPERNDEAQTEMSKSENENEVAEDDEKITHEENQKEKTADDSTNDMSRAVYIDLFDEVELSKASDEISLKVFSREVFAHKIKAQIICGNGNVKNLEFAGDISAGQWNTLTLELPNDVEKPVKLSRIYVLYTPGEAMDEGCVYIDSVSMTASCNYTLPNAPMNVYAFNKHNSNVESKVVVGAVPEWENNNPVTLLEITKTKNEILADNGFVISAQNNKGVSEDDNAVYVSLDTSGGGIRKTDSSQWELLEKAVASSDRQNLVILANDSIFGNDEFENEVIKDYLASLDKKVFVVSAGNSATYMNIDGVRYFTLDNTPKTTLSLIKEKMKNAIEFSFGDTVTFEFVAV